MALSASDGKKLIGIARNSILNSFSGRKAAVDKKDVLRLSEKKGVFVTLTIDGELRGCIGFVEPIYPLHEAVAKAAEHAAFEDPRFPQLSEDEARRIRVEVTVLDLPERIEADKEKDIIDAIEIGKHGLIIRYGFNSGLLLPQVATEWKWGKREFLENTCMKAGLEKDSWKEEGCEISIFKAKIFSEK